MSHHAFFRTDLPIPAADAALRRAVMDRIGDLEAISTTEDHLLRPAQEGPVSAFERLAVAFHVAALLGHGDLKAGYQRALADVASPGDLRVEQVRIETLRAAAVFPDSYRVDGPGGALLGDRLVSAFAYVRGALSGWGHARALPRGWDREGAEVISRILSLVSFRARTLESLRLCAEARRSFFAAE